MSTQEKTMVTVPLEEIESARDRLNALAVDVGEVVLNAMSSGLDGEDPPQPSQRDVDVDVDAVRSHLSVLREAFGCGSLEASMFVPASGDEESLANLPGYIEDLRKAIEGLENASVTDVTEALSDVSSELGYVERFADGFELRSDIEDRIGRMRDALEALAEMGL